MDAKARIAAVKRRIELLARLEDALTSPALLVEAARKKKSREDAGKYKHINFVPNASVAKAAARGLKLRDKFNRGGTAVGIARGRDLANRKKLSPTTIKRMRSFFARHEGNKKPGWSKPSDPTNGYIAHLLWGGDAGRSWANKIVRQMESADKKAKAAKKKKKPAKKKRSRKK